MSWVKYINIHREFLLEYFPNSCARCIYKDLSQSCPTVSIDDFAMIYCKESPHRYLDEFDCLELCDLCIEDAPRSIDAVIFEILQKIFEEFDSIDYRTAIDILNKNNIVQCPKERLFLHYIRQCKRAGSIAPYEAYICKLLRLGIRADFHYSKLRVDCIPYYFAIRYTCAFTQSIVDILKACGYSTYTINEADCLPRLTELGCFVIFW